MSEVIKMSRGYNNVPKLHGTLSAERWIDASKNGVVSLKIVKEKRGLTKNALSHVWYAQLDVQAFPGDRDGYSRRFCKAYFGVPIMRKDEDFRERYDRLVSKRFSYEEKLELMEWLPITSLMSDKQMKDYLCAMQEYFAEKGVILSTPKDDAYASWASGA